MKKTLIELLKNTECSNDDGIIAKPLTIEEYEFSLYKINKVTFDEDSPRREAFENVLNSLNIDGIIFTYILMGTKNNVSFYFGISKDKSYKGRLELEVDDIAETILKPSIEGNFRGSVVEKLLKSERNAVRETLAKFSQVGKLSGVPCVHEDNEEFQGVDRLVDIMSGDEFCLLIMADPLSLLQINEIENQLYKIYDKLCPLSKQSLQVGKNSSQTTGKTEGSNTSRTTGTNDSLNISTNTGTNDSTTKGTSESSSKSGTSQSRTEGKSEGRSDSKTKGTSISDSTGDSISTSVSDQTGESESSSREFSDKSLQEWIKYIDEVLLKRVQYGKNKGLYLSNIYLFANTKGSVVKLGNTARALFSGGETNKSPLTFSHVHDSNEIETVQNFQFPILKEYDQKVEDATENSQLQFDLLMSKNPFDKYLCNWLSTNELSVIAGLPQKEVVGLSLKEEVEFGLNVSTSIPEPKQLFLGQLVKSGIVQKDIDICINSDDLDKHLFIAGVTGSGKTTTCQRILESAKMPFLVIEPAKTEYRVLTKKNKDILIFTLGNDNIAPFRLNPFEFFPHENITSRVDMIKASIEAAFDMEAAIPQIIEAAIYRCYEDKGWNIATSRNTLYEDPFAATVNAFPTLSDLIKATEEVVAEQGFDDRLKQDYIGSIKARLQGLLVGAKGQMLNTPRSLNFKDLTKRSVILELEEIRNPSEKSLIMGFILANLNEAIRSNYEEYRKKGDRFKHITLIEEAHRLLSKFSPGDSSNKKQGVETFTDMLAEVRKYGESLIIVDQIPNKLTPEVLKNTNTKIIHKLFAKDDKEAVGNTMALSEEQMDFLSNLEPGRVILSSTGFDKPVQMQIKELISTTNEVDVDPQAISDIALQYYVDNYKNGIVQGLELLEQLPSKEDMHLFLNGLVATTWKNTLQSKKATPELLQYLKKYGYKFLAHYFGIQFYENNMICSKKNLIEYLHKLSLDPETSIADYRDYLATKKIEPKNKTKVK